MSSARIASQAALAVKRESQTVEVKGYSERRILSDLAAWSATFTARGESLASASARLQADRRAVLAWLEELGVPPQEFEIHPVQTLVLFARRSLGIEGSRMIGARNRLLGILADGGG